jgi:hypothetical protein
MEIVGWQVPSARQSSSSTNQNIASTLKLQKGEWAIVEEKPLEGDPKSDEARDLRSKASNRASLIKNGRLAPFRPPGVFDAVSRSEVTEEGNNVVRVYAMYQGEEFAKPPKAKKEKDTAPAETPAEAPAAV